MGLKKTKNTLRIYLKNTWKVQHLHGMEEIIVGERIVYKKKYYIDIWVDGKKPSWVKRFNYHHEKKYKPENALDKYLAMKSEREIEMFYGSEYYDEFKGKWAFIHCIRVSRIMPVFTISGELNCFNLHKTIKAPYKR